MALFVNIITLFACFASMAYCYVLSKRIRAFDNIKDGVGALIEEMIRTTNDLQMAFNHTQQNIDTQNNKLQDKIDESVVITEYLGSLIEEAQANIAQLSLSNQAQLKSLDNIPKATHREIQKTPIYNDVLEDVVPADLNQFKRNKRHQAIIPGEEYL